MMRNTSFMLLYHQRQRHVLSLSRTFKAKSNVVVGDCKKHYSWYGIQNYITSSIIICRCYGSSTVVMNNNATNSNNDININNNDQRLNKTTLELANRILDTNSSILQRRIALSRAITLIETNHPEKKIQAELLLSKLLQNQTTTITDNNDNNKSLFPSNFRIGFAGPPGAGKSTMVEALGMFILQQQQQNIFFDKLAVVCIDPSSQVTGGSILGDKTRMTELSKHERAYLRPSPNAGIVGGLAAYTHDVVSTCHAAGYDLVFVETVGLGQSEIEVAQSVDLLLLVLPPGGGDELQGVKKGIVEVANIVVVTKADGSLLPSAKTTVADYRGALKLLHHTSNNNNNVWNPPVVMTSAVTKMGLQELWNQILQYRQYVMNTTTNTNSDDNNNNNNNTSLFQQKRQEQANYWMWKHFQRFVLEKTQQNDNLAQTAKKLQEMLQGEQITPRLAASQLLDTLLKKSGSGGEW